MPKKTVTFSVEPNSGQFTYSHDPVKQKRGEKIDWKNEKNGQQQGPWILCVKDSDSPFRSRIIRSGKGNAAGAAVRGNAPAKTYEYFICVEVNGEIFGDDPRIEVEPS